MSVVNRSPADGNHTRKRHRNFMSIDECEVKVAKQESQLQNLKKSSEWENLNASERRRLRNMQLARRTRLRNKSTERDLLEQLEKLNSENKELKNQVHALTFEAPLSAIDLLKEEYAIPNDLVSVGDGASLTEADDCFFLISTMSPKLPIVHATNSFLTMSGYQRCEIIGQQGLFMFAPYAMFEDDPANTSNAVSLIQIIADLKAGRCHHMKMNVIARRKGGHHFVACCIIEPVIDPSGRCFFMKVHCRTADSDGEKTAIPLSQWKGTTALMDVIDYHAAHCKKDSSPGAQINCFRASESMRVCIAFSRSHCHCRGT